MAFSCKRRGFCQSCSALRMVKIAALLVDEVMADDRNGAVVPDHPAGTVRLVASLCRKVEIPDQHCALSCMG